MLRVFSVDEEGELSDDGEPDVVGSDDEVVVIVVSLDDGVNEAVGAGVKNWREVVVKRGVDHGTLG